MDTTLPLEVKAIDVLYAARDTYANYGDDNYAQTVSYSFLRRCIVPFEYCGPDFPVRKETIERVIFAMLCDESEELFIKKLLSRLEISK